MSEIKWGESIVDWDAVPKLNVPIDVTGCRKATIAYGEHVEEYDIDDNGNLIPCKAEKGNKLPNWLKRTFYRNKPAVGMVRK